MTKLQTLKRQLKKMAIGSVILVSLSGAALYFSLEYMAQKETEFKQAESALNVVRSRITQLEQKFNIYESSFSQYKKLFNLIKIVL